MQVQNSQRFISFKVSKLSNSNFKFVHIVFLLVIKALIIQRANYQNNFIIMLIIFIFYFLSQILVYHNLLFITITFIFSFLNICFHFYIRIFPYHSFKVSFLILLIKIIMSFLCPDSYQSIISNFRGHIQFGLIPVQYHLIQIKPILIYSLQPLILNLILIFICLFF